MNSMVREVLAGTVIAALVAICATPESRAGELAANVLVVHGFAGPAADPDNPVDVLVNGTFCAIEGLTFGQIVGPLPLEPGSYRIDILRGDAEAPCSKRSLAGATVDLEAGELASVVAYRNEAMQSFVLEKFTTDPTLSMPGEGLASVLHAATAPPVDLYIKAADGTMSGDDDDDDDDDAGNAKVCICHAPPGNPTHAKTICVGAHAAAAHLRNHSADTLGVCKSDDGQIDPDAVVIEGVANGDQFTGALAPGDYEVFVTAAGDARTLAGPLPLAVGADRIEFLYAIGSIEEGGFEDTFTVVGTSLAKPKRLLLRIRTLNDLMHD